MSNWWTRHLGDDTNPPAPPQQPQPYVPPAQPAPYQQPNPYAPPQYPQPGYPPTQEPGSKRVVNKDNIVDAVYDPSSYEGLVTQSMKAGDTQHCPECNSPRFYQQQKQAILSATSGQMAAPKPRCADCGYPTRQGPN